MRINETHEETTICQYQLNILTCLFPKVPTLSYQTDKHTSYHTDKKKPSMKYYK